ncbi:pentatricopeptide repeat-containing protein At4g13650 [Aegilops tauschii subsp. strangulata]|nr:pentatricopeptide repeat-containing protein At4g13650 [Aegilops tauschii subsp. strangulata]XP_040250646.1 pentatricopeptide repeat-containing protein At4g13650 [Aegilops tauschii subsp. strangulata]XP_044443116.1 pentatricopeptide repeat-containing protein At4g13650-like [Triticum aestivum]XP_044443117.1 pentatricopeptide repeat-containing protein At4g13650-like [Triticum aestivum]XP_044443118.1 pentatricopeptide repeat-containing protein At4g13650-like [Triticum aestivum]XP_044443119.1 pe
MHDHLAALLRGGGGGRHPRAVHGAAAKLGCLASTYLCNNLLLSYISGSLHAEARRLFDEMPQRNVVSWSVLVSGASRLGDLREASFLFSDMLRSGESGSCDRPNSFVLGALVAGCARAKDTAAGSQAHASALKFGVAEDESVAGALVDMYSKCGRVDLSWRAFAVSPQRCVASWTSIISCLVNQGCSEHRDAAISLLKKMLLLKVWPTNATFSCILKVFDAPELLPGGKQIHGCLLKMGTEVDPALGTALIAMYGRCGGVNEMSRLSCRIRHDAFSRTSLLVAFARNGCNMDAVWNFREMVMENMAIDQSAVTSLLQVCSSLGQLRVAKEVHCYALKTFFKLDTLLLNATITVYGRCGDVTSAEIIFNRLENKDIISWTALLTCYAQNNLALETLLLFREMLRKGLGSPVFCITSVLRACSSTTNYAVGWQIHSRVVKLGLDDANSVENALLTMYAKCGSVHIALKIFNSMRSRGIISWNALITSFSQHGNEVAAIQLFDLMQEEAVCPDDYTFVGLLSSCSRMGLVAEGCEYFKLMNTKYSVKPKMEHYTCMVDLFARAGRFSDALEFIDAMPCHPDQLVWEALLASCRTHGNVELGRLAAKKILEIRPDDPSPYITLSSIHASIDMWEEKAWNRTVFDVQQVRKDVGSSWVAGEEFSDNTCDVLQVGIT